MSTSSSVRRASLLITPAALAEDLSKTPESIKILDATWFMPNLVPPRNPYKEFLAGPRLKGVTGFWDVDDVADKTHPLGLKHMLPSPDNFAQACSKLGIQRDSKVVVYDTHGVFSAPRTVFSFKAFEHPEVYVLDGGLPRWKAEGFPVEEGQFSSSETNYPTPSFDKDFIRSYKDVSSNASKSSEDPSLELVLDARPGGRFSGSDPEPRPGLSSGHMPHSVSLPFSVLLSEPSSTQPSYKTLLPRDKLKDAILKALGGDQAKLQALLAGKLRVVNSCGSGMTAAIIWLALQELGVKSAVYDESWTGYAMRKESKILKA
ncbi:Rhodanese-like protein [Cystobasidium minutum MCA 4210]|uniref:Rhodanese-like protein n=1 Tax=Cystobasidium minutum MCA 4210 TaxID=1397322 RepID=UPI0034CDA6EB|eukprot:jgi/Rhomi1/192028/gm1.242_g